MASYIKVNLDTSKENYLLEKCKQNDDIRLEAFIFENGAKKDLTNTQITINVIKPDKTFVKQNGGTINIQENKITCLLDEQVTIEPGMALIDISLVDNKNLQNTTFEFKLLIKKLVTHGAVKSSNAVPILKELDDKITEAGRIRDETERLIREGGVAKGVSVYIGNQEPPTSTDGNKENDLYINDTTNNVYKRNATGWVKKGKLPTDVVNNLLSNSATSALSANQGRVLDLSIKDLEKRASVPQYSLDKIIEEQGGNITDGIQWAFTDACTKGIGRILLDQTYEIDRPIIIERLNENTNTSIEVYGGGVIKKSANFTGNQLILIKQGFHDEDNIVFNDISFDGVNYIVNGIDTFEGLVYHQEPTLDSIHHESKFIKFNDCSFNNCYHGVRLSSLSWVFSGCLFHSNYYGIYLDYSANANSFIGCSIRRNTVGVKLRQVDTTVGTVGNGFYNCTIESNENLGIVSKKSRNTTILGCYFENNGHKINNQYEHYISGGAPKKVHIWLDDIGGSGYHNIENFYNTSDFDIVGCFNNSKVVNNCKIELTLCGNATFTNNDISNINFVGYNNFASDFVLDGVEYVSTTNAKKLYRRDEIIKNEVDIKEPKYVIESTSTINNDTVELMQLTIEPCNFMFIEINAILKGLNVGGNVMSQGVITGKIAIAKATNDTENYTAHTSGLHLINCEGAISGHPNGKTLQKIFLTNASVISSSQGNVITLSVKGIDKTGMDMWGATTSVTKRIKLNYLIDVII